MQPTDSVIIYPNVSSFVYEGFTGEPENLTDVFAYRRSKRIAETAFGAESRTTKVRTLDRMAVVRCRRGLLCKGVCCKVGYCVCRKVGGYCGRVFPVLYGVGIIRPCRCAANAVKLRIAVGYATLDNDRQAPRIVGG